MTPAKAATDQTSSPQALAERWTRLMMTIPAAAQWGPDAFPLIPPWFEAFAGPAPASAKKPGAGDTFTFSLAVALDFLHSGWSVEGPGPLVLPRLAHFMGEQGAPDALLEPLRTAGKALLPDAAGVWIMGSGEGMDLGWYFPEPFSFRVLRPHVRSLERLKGLERWGRGLEVSSVVLFGGSLSEENAFSVLHIELPGADLASQLDAARTAFEALEVPFFAAATTAALQAFPPPIAEGSGLQLVVWLTENSVLKAAVQVPSPSLDLVLRLATQVAVQNLEPLAAVEGTLDVKGATSLELQQLAGQFRVEMQYRLAPFPVVG